MAKINFSALVEEIIGKLAGSVFQDSYQGYQIRSRVTPRNPRTSYQQLRRGEFGFLTSTWRDLTPTERQTWIDNAPPGMQGLNFYVQSNVNVILTGLPPMRDTTPGTIPEAFPITISELNPPAFTIQATTSLNIVPAGQNLLILATAERPPSQLFNNPSNFQPIVTFASGSNLTGGAPIGIEWRSHYGIMRGAYRICVKAVLIDAATGLRGPESIACAIESELPDNVIVDADGTFIVSSTGDFLTSTI